VISIACRSNLQLAIPALKRISILRTCLRHNMCSAAAEDVFSRTPAAVKWLSCRSKLLLAILHLGEEDLL